MAEKNKPEQKLEKDLKISATQEKLQGVYSNYARISHVTKNEFIIDFLLFGGDINTQLVSRIITSPEHMKKLAIAISNNLERYENKHGEIIIED